MINNDKKKKLVSGITATGKLTLGNYLGAIKQFIKLQDEYDSYFFVADLHALTGDISKLDLKQNRKDIFALYLACGLDPEKCCIFFQSDVLEHTYLNWILTNNSTMGELSRMTQFKDKSSRIKTANNTETIPTGLFMYPILMAADIILYEPDVVPVGIDQTQHVELTRTIINRINNKYNLNINEPVARIPEIGAKIMSLVDPSKKMSKSDPNPKASIYLLDNPKEAYNKILKAVTDSENKVYLDDNKPGIKNLLTIYSALNDIDIKEAAEKFKNANYLEFKEAVAENVKTFLEKIQEKFKGFYSKIDFYAKAGAQKASAVAGRTMKKITKKIGLGD
ncbi:tryptophanyl-tRNA synthetase [Mycoplasmopsis californica]|uniref:Tryptophan--tRNA ligase n=1 Tax=Mycoplasmopsis equigenitalium TaxID=114883 RepID=A0ABY5J5J8_9BACT|nr:tryptophan--tRNA ligase [Mycoplasmopsis equigenitalium]UUD37240.1 tryptophan--tRNA ligase [Mycoplasmopsis equigenitalium]VEU69452.1 tryptophanyl-tRNA synthetase [Mycoplasmopsis californica]